MKKFEKPEMKVLKFDKDDVIRASSCNPYNCPGAYGGYCDGGHGYCSNAYNDPCSCDAINN